jgi:hypothetical protein
VDSSRSGGAREQGLVETSAPEAVATGEGEGQRMKVLLILASSRKFRDVGEWVVMGGTLVLAGDDGQIVELMSTLMSSRKSWMIIGGSPGAGGGVSSGNSNEGVGLEKENRHGAGVLGGVATLGVGPCSGRLRVCPCVRPDVSIVGASGGIVTLGAGSGSGWVGEGSGSIAPCTGGHQVPPGLKP